MKYIHIEDQLFVCVPELKEEIASEFNKLANLVPAEQTSETENHLLALNIIYKFLETLVVPMTTEADSNDKLV